MATEFKLPALSPTMEKGNLAKWLVKEGDVIRSGDLIAEIETDKATMEVEASDDGRVVTLVVPGGTENVPVGTVIAILADADAPTTEAPAPSVAEMPRPETAPEPAAPVAVAPSPAPASPLPASAPVGVPSLDTTANATPLARRLAASNNIDLARVSGSGPNGKITRRDLGLPALHIAAPVQTSTPAASLAPAKVIAPPPEGVPVVTEKLSTMRRTIARRLSESKQTVPHFYLTARCNIDPLLKLRMELNADLSSRGIKLSVNDLLIKALAIAMMREPEANVQFGGDVIHRFSRADISMAVAIDGGLITPVIRGADALSLSAIAEQSKTLAEKARAGKLLPEDYQGGTASISNLGMFGIDEMFPVINPPQSLIIGIGAGIEQPWKVDGQIGLATIMAATASFDHRAIDGAVAARFMAAFKELVERPMTLLT